LIAAALAFAVTIAGISYQTFEAKADARRFHQEGKSVDVGGYKLNINCTGQGSPTVILESGLEVPAIGWRFVQPDVSKFTRVCSYDRAGYAWSDSGPFPRTHAQIVQELHTLLRNARETPPYILVGHSFGTTNVRICNGLYPNEVVGMVLAEGGPDDLKFPASILKLSLDNLKERQRNRTFALIRFTLGISRYLVRKKIENPASSHGAQEWWYDSIQPKFVAATTTEVENIFNEDGANDLKRAGTLGDKPLIVLIAGKGMWGLPLVSQDWVDLRKMWVDGQMRLAQQLTSRGKWLIVSDSAHMIPYERPDAIVSAVREIYASVSLQ